MSARLKKALCIALVVIAIGAIYALFVTLTGIAIPCVFRLITGFQCPGCGVTRMCLALLRLDFATAFYSNPAVFCLLPLMVFTAGRMLYVYIRYDRKREKLTQILLYVMIVILLIFAVLRNIL